MVLHAKLHHLIRTIHRARVFAYCISVLILSSRMLYIEASLPYVLFLIFLLAYPHLNSFICGYIRNTAVGARYSLLPDGCLVGTMIVVAEFNLLVCVAFIAALVMGTLMVAKPRMLVINLGLLLASSCLSYIFLEPDIYAQGWFVTNLLASVLIVGYGGLVASLGFVETSDLEKRRREIDRDRLLLQGIYNRLRPYVSPQLAASLEVVGNMPTSRKKITVFFSDIEGFTELMDSLSEALITRILNEYLNEMAEIAIAHGGTVDKFIGDGVMIFFGAPDSRGHAQDAIACVRMAVAMFIKLEELRSKWIGEGIPAGLHIRIGIHSGYCAVGNFGSKQRMDYTAIGAVVNLASRLESAADRDAILVSIDTWELVKGEVQGEMKHPIRVKGIARAISVVAIIGVQNSETSIKAPRFRLMSGRN
ncbi:MAG: adenylate/guanylate cyclase domain-containing protein [Gammaproteobacteria bacterium]|nr:adenylate/guanylate cyclase domain-containing protein [Gammaproteobacteria bacterium]